MSQPNKHPVKLNLTGYPAKPAIQPEDTLLEATHELNSLIGLPSVKAEVKRLMSFLKVQQERRKHGLRESNQTLHFVFTGNPGTGKTTVARIVSKILCGFGLLKTAKVVECDRSKLVAGYLGQTAIKTNEIIDTALDGVLFIDEAYSLSDAFDRDIFGQEAINTLLKRMEDDRDRIIVIAAGYPRPMGKFLRSNPGLESRFTRFIRFEDYEVADLCRIFEKFISEAEYTLTPNCRGQASLLFTLAHHQRDERFGNARFVRNVFEQATSLHSQRLAELPVDKVSKEALMAMEAVDIPFDSINLNINAVSLQGAQWDAECPGCGKASSAGLKYLGQRVSCKCGQKFLFPWWSLVLSSVKGVPAELLSAPQVSDKRGEIEKEKTPPDVSNSSTIQVVDDNGAWKADPVKAASFVEDGLRYLKNGQPDRAIKCFETAISIDWANSDPGKQPYYRYRAEAYEMNGNDNPMAALKAYSEGIQSRSHSYFQGSVAAYENSIEFDPTYPWSPNNLAWLYATCVESKLRNGAKAIKYATTACSISKWRCWSFIDTLSAAYAEAGDFDSAVKYAELAFSLAPLKNQSEVQENINRFRARQPLHLDY